jgi:hypothetical protein
MKKFITLLLVTGLLLPGLPAMAEIANTSENTSEEKIPSPEHIKLYKNIRKVDKSLYGIRIKSSNDTKPNEEKILSLEDVKYFSHIRKVGESLYGIRIDAKAAPVQLTAETLACAKTALGKREDAAIIAYDTYATSIKEALAKRKTDQMAAMEIIDQSARRKALAKALIDFNKARELAVKNRHESIKKAAETFRLETKTCKANIIATEADTLSVDKSL